MEPSGLLAQLRTSTVDQIEKFRSALLNELRPDEKDDIFGEHTSLYAVGSAGRMEMSPHSDFDLFIVRTPEKSIRRIDEARLQSALVRVHRDLNLPEPSKDGDFLRMHSSNNFVELLGQPRDDIENTFTARMLLLLESTPICGPDVYNRVVESAINAYWTNVDSHHDDYHPFFLLNDIVRYWRNLLLNYEWKTADKLRTLEHDRASTGMSIEEYDRQKMLLDSDKWRRSCKLRFARCLTCYGTIAWLLAEARATNNVRQNAFREAVRLTPLDRLRKAAELGTSADSKSLFRRLETAYALFLESFSIPPAQLLEKLGQRDFRKEQLEKAYAFGDNLFEFIQLLGQGNKLYRYLVI
jgi:hypothetical protein